MPYGVIFDMDGVLVDSGPAHHESWRQLARRHELDISDESFKQHFGRPSRDIISALFGDQLRGGEIRRLDEEKEQLYRTLIADRIPLMPGCRETLTALEKSGLRLAVATSGPPENVDLVLSEGLIANYFAATVNGFEIARGKPAPDCFLLAADRLSLKPAECVVIEDAPVGVQAGVAAGMKVIGLAGTHAAEPLTQAGAARVVTKLPEITANLIRQLLAPH